VLCFDRFSNPLHAHPRFQVLVEKYRDDVEG